MTEFLQEHLFQDKFDRGDDREPLVRVGRWGVTGTKLMEPLFLAQMLILVVITQLVCSLVAVVAYYRIVQLNKAQKYRDPIRSCLLSYGLLLPVLLCTPYWLTEKLDVRNCLLLLPVVGSPLMATLKLLETLHAERELPAFTQNNLWYFVLYFTIPMVIEYDEKGPIRITPSQMQQKIRKSTSLFLQASFLLSFLGAHEYSMFPSREIASFWDLFYWGNLCNNLMGVTIVSVTLDLGCTVGEVLLSVVTGGVHFIDSHRSPMTASVSVSEFWAKRWNRLVGESLKRGVHGSLRRILPRSVSAISTFLASGLAHEYMLFVLSKARGPDVAVNNRLNEPYEHQLGRQFAFFVYNGALLILEDLWRGHWALVWMQTNFPRPVRTALVSLLVLPVTFLFTDEYDSCGIFRDVALSVPRIRLVPDSTPIISHPVIDDMLEQNWTSFNCVVDSALTSWTSPSAVGSACF